MICGAKGQTLQQTKAREAPSMNRPVRGNPMKRPNLRKTGTLVGLLAPTLVRKFHEQIGVSRLPRAMGRILPLQFAFHVCVARASCLTGRETHSQARSWEQTWKSQCLRPKVTCPVPPRQRHGRNGSGRMATQSHGRGRSWPCSSR